MLKSTIVVGNPKPGSKTRAVAEALTDALLGHGPRDQEVIELAEHTGGLFSFPSDELDPLIRRVLDSDLLVVASPTYKATYTGLLKAFFDHFGTGVLRGVIAVPVMTGGDLQHSLAPANQLAPLLAEIGASVPLPGLYFVARDMDRLDQIVSELANDYKATLAVLGSTVAGILPTTAAGIGSEVHA